MDTPTQALLGAAVGGAVMGRQAGWRAFVWGGAVAVLPDLDQLIPYGDPVATFTYHRSYSHALAVQTAAAPLLAWPIQRLHGGAYRRWLLAVWLALITHALLDACTVYGTQLFLPFSAYPVGLGSIFIIDPLFSLPLLIGLIGALAAGAAGARGQRWNTAGLMLATGYLAWSIGAQQWIETRAERALAHQGLPTERVLVTPTPFNTLLWRIVAVGETAYWEGFHRLGADRAIDFQRHASDPSLLHGISERWPVRRLQWFTKGFYAVEEHGGKIVITDLRMGQAGYYAFAFTVGQRRNGRSIPLPSERYRYPWPDLRIALSDLLACARGRAARVLGC